ncbi:hypothetical protein FEM08_21580 [Flavobacterium gilvum]|nr:hypothetical protein FEM08_21580 [Flavobacterium gilvum]
MFFVEAKTQRFSQCMLSIVALYFRFKNNISAKKATLNGLLFCIYMRFIL